MTDPQDTDRRMSLSQPRSLFSPLDISESLLTFLYIMLGPAAIPKMGKYLYDHPEGVSPRMTPRAQNPDWKPEKGLGFFIDVANSVPKDSFVEACGEVGDVYLLHPLMLHSASNNKLRELRVITNPPVSINEPFNFDRQDESQYSVVEKKTMAALKESGCELKGWKVTGSRDVVVPERLRIQAAMREQELKRLEELKSEDVSAHGANGFAPSQRGQLADFT